MGTLTIERQWQPVAANTLRSTATMAKSKNRKPANTIVIEPEASAELVEEIGEDAANELEEITVNVEEDGKAILDAYVHGNGEKDQDQDGVKVNDPAKTPEPETVEEPETAPAQTLEVLENRVLELATKLVASYTGGDAFTQEDKEEMAALNVAIASYTSGDAEATAKKISKDADTIGTVALSAASMEVFNVWTQTWTEKDGDGNVTADVGDFLASFNDRAAMLAWAHLDEDGNQVFGNDGDSHSLRIDDLLVAGTPAGDGLGDFHVAWSGKSGETLDDQIKAHLAEIALKQWLRDQLVLGHSLITGTITGKVVLKGDGKRRVDNYLYASTATFKKTGTGKVTGGTGDGATASTEYQSMKKNGNGTIAILEPFKLAMVGGGELDFPTFAVDDIQYLVESWIEKNADGKAPSKLAVESNCNRFGGVLGNVAKNVVKGGLGYYHGGWENTKAPASATTGMKWLQRLEQFIRAAVSPADAYKFAENVVIGNTATKRLIDMEMLAKVKESMPVSPVDQPEDGNQDGGTDA
jgi:HPt (histidine-containing phosphotransfer) domain-containing protein